MATDLGRIDHQVWESEFPQGNEMEMPDGTVSHEFAKGGHVDPEKIAMAAVSALHGFHPDPDGALSAFEQTFGHGSTDGLRHTVFGGGEPQTEGFVDDDSPGMADTVEADGPRGEGSIALSGGEYIIPADVVSNIGDGNSAAGSKVLDELVAHVRQMKHGTSDQPAPTGRAAVEGFMKQG